MCTHTGCVLERTYERTNTRTLQGVSLNFLFVYSLQILDKKCMHTALLRTTADVLKYRMLFGWLAHLSCLVSLEKVPVSGGEETPSHIRR